MFAIAFVTGSLWKGKDKEQSSEEKVRQVEGRWRVQLTSQPQSVKKGKVDHKCFFHRDRRQL